MLRTVETYYDRRSWLKSGCDVALTYEMATPLLREMVASMTTAMEVQERPTTAQEASSIVPTGVFRFAHAETLLPFICLLTSKATDVRSLQKGGRSRRFFAAREVPFGANVGFWLYAKTTEMPFFRVSVLINEVPLHFVGCPVSGPCRFATFRRLFASYLDHWQWETHCDLPSKTFL